MSVEPGITIGFLNRLLVAEGLSLAVVPEVFHDHEIVIIIRGILIMIMMKRMMTAWQLSRRFFMR